MAKKKTRPMRNPETGQLIAPSKPKADWADKMLENADNRSKTIFEQRPEMAETLRILLERAAERGMELSRAFLCRAIQERHGVKIVNNTLGRFLHEQAPKEIREAWAKVRRSHGRSMG